MVISKSVVHVADLATEEVYVTGDPTYVAGVELGGVRTFLAVPMLKDNELIGAFAVARHQVGPFNDKQIELVKNFATQAVIAIENARLLNELRQRTNDLTEALEQQTATADVLQVISSSPGELEPVFETMLENAARICDAKFGNIYRWDGDVLHLVASHNTPPPFADFRRRVPVSGGTSVPGRIVRTRAVVHVEDLAADQAYIERNPQTVAAVELGRTRTLLAVPMLKDDQLIGSFSLFRQEVRPLVAPSLETYRNSQEPVCAAVQRGPSIWK